MKTVLLAEGHLPTLRHLAELLKHGGFRVLSASKPSEALELFVAEQPDAVVVGLGLPPLDDGPLSLRLRSTAGGERIPLLIVDQGHLGKPHGVQAILGLKANAYVADPLKPSELLNKLQSLLEAAAPAAEEASPVARLLATPPIAGGELRALNLPRVALQLHRSKRPGILLVVHRGVSRRLFMLNGALAAFESSAGAESFVSYLLEQGLISKAQADAAEASTRQGLRLLTALGEAGLELPLESLREKLGEYTFERARQVFGMREGKYTFHEGGGFEGAVALVNVPLLACMFAGVRASYPLRSLLQPLQPHLSQFPSRTAQFAADVSDLALSPADLKVVMQVSGRIQLRDLLAHGRGDVRLNTSLMWLLTVTGGVSYEARPQALGPLESSPAPDTIGPRKRKALPPETVAELRDAALKIVTGSYFHVLGVSINATQEDIQRAYEETAVRFHPDSYAEYDASELQDLLEAVQDKLAAAMRVLSDEERRRAYLEHLLGRMGSSRVGPPNAEAERILREGDEALRRRDFRAALASYERAIALNPREPEYYPRAAWALLRSEDGPSAERLKGAHRHLKRALALDGNLERAHVILAILELEAGQAPAARKRLVQVLSRNPESKLARVALRRVSR